MKLTAPKNVADYLHDTEHAVRHFYAGLDSCWSFYQEATKHWNITRLNEPLTPEKKAGIDRYLDLAGKYFELKLSEAMFSGAILQAAYMAIRLFSQNTTIPSDAAHLVQASQKSAVKFCIGPLRYGIRSGLIVFAARNQYNHWDEAEPRSPTKKVFDALSLAFRDNTWSDLAFELSNPTINVYANEILLTALGWTTYDRYLAEISAVVSDLPGPEQLANA